MSTESEAGSAKRLIDAVLPRGGYIVSLVEAYFDESGSHDGSPVLCVAGYLIESENAKALTDEWNAVLDESGLTYFHMVDCAQGAEEFAELEMPERIAVQTKLIEITKSRIERGIGVLIVPRLYEELMPYHPNMGSAYNYCLWNCLDGVKQWIEETGFQGDVAYFFESGHASQSEANRIMHQAFEKDKSRRMFGYLSHSFVDKKKFPGVQAADILAWQSFTDWKHDASGMRRRKDFAYLIDGKNHRHQVLDAKRIAYHARLMREQGAWGEAPPDMTA